MKLCPSCRVAKPLTDFHKNRAHSTGLASECKPCATERVRRWKEANAEHVRAKAKERYVRTSDGQRARAKAWHHANKSRAEASAAAWREANKEKIKARKRLDASGFTEATMAEALRRQGMACAICRKDLATLPSRQIHADHDHATGAPRGVLCHHCNVALGYFRDSEKTLRAALAYLASPPLGGL